MSENLENFNCLDNICENTVLYVVITADRSGVESAPVELPIVTSFWHCSCQFEGGGVISIRPLRVLSVTVVSQIPMDDLSALDLRRYLADVGCRMYYSAAE